jgi:hypothetical protein
MVSDGCASRRVLTVAAALAGATGAAPAVIRLDPPKDGDKVLGREAEQGRASPAQRVWARMLVTAAPKT